MKLPQLHIRDFFWLVLVCELAVGWCVERQKLRAKIDKLEGIERIITVIPNHNVYDIEQKRRQAERWWPSLLEPLNPTGD